MTRRRKVIQVSPKYLDVMAEEMNCTRSAVYNALAFRSNSEKAMAIRNMAIDTYGGKSTFKYVM